VEITAVERGRDVHVLGVPVRRDRARTHRVSGEDSVNSGSIRVVAISERLAELGMPIDTSELVVAAQSNTGQSVGRPQIARAMIAAGHADTVDEVFQKWLAGGKPAFVPRPATPAEDVIGVIHAAAASASLAHPGGPESTATSLGCATRGSTRSRSITPTIHPRIASAI